MAQGIDGIPLRIPATWDAKWFADFIREVLAKADIRNAIPGPGITIEGQSDEPATLSAEADVLQLLEQNYILATTSAFLANERILQGEDGVVSTTDAGPGGAFTIGVENNGIGAQKFRASPALSVVGRPQATDGNVNDIIASANDLLLTRIADRLDFTQLTLGMAANDLWTYAKLQNVSATSRILGRITASAGDIEELTAANVKTILALVAADISDFVEAAQDAVGAALTDTSEIDFTYNDGSNAISAALVAASVAFAKLQNIATSKLLGRSTVGSGSIEEISIGSGLSLSAGTLTATGSYTDEQAQDSVGTILTDSTTVDLTYNDGAPSISAAVIKQMSLDSDASGLKLVNDSSTPGNSKYYGTDGGGAKGFFSLATGSDLTAYKASTTSRSSNSTPAADPDLSVTLATGTYSFEIFLYASEAPTGGGGFIFNLAGGSVVASSVRACAMETYGNSNNIILSLSDLIAFSVFGSGAGGQSGIVVTGGITVSSAGTFAVNWSQYVSNANASKLEINSWMRVRKLS